MGVMARPKIDQRQYAAATPEERRGVVVSVLDRRERMHALEQLMIAGVSMSRIEDMMRDKFSMPRGKVRQYVDAVRAQWAEEESRARPTKKAQAIRRCLGHIAEARRDKNWAAVAQFEKHLAMLEGTYEAVEVNLNIDATITEASLHVIANLTPERRAALIAQQRELRALAAAKPVIDTTGVEVPSRTLCVPGARARASVHTEQRRAKFRG